MKKPWQKKSLMQNFTTVKIRNPLNVSLIDQALVEKINSHTLRQEHGSISKFLNDKFYKKFYEGNLDNFQVDNVREFKLISANPKLIHLKNSYVNWQMYVFRSNKKLVQENLNSYWEWDDGMIPSEIFKPNKMTSLILKLLKNMLSWSEDQYFKHLKKSAFVKFSHKVFGEKFKSVEKIEYAIVFTDTYWYNFGHFVIENFPRLHYIFKSIPYHELKKYKIVLPPIVNYYEQSEGHFKFIMPFLEALNISPDQCIHLEKKSIIKVKHLLLPAPIRHHPWILESLDFVKKYYDNGCDFKYDKIYLSRKKALRRRIVNEEQVENLLVHLGFKIIIVEEMDFRERINILKNVKILVAQDSSTILNVFLCPENIKCLVFCCKKIVAHLFCSAIKSHFHYQFCESEEKDNFDWYTSNIVVDITALEFNLKRLEEMA